ncbi:MAG: DUF3467 domain-containing protein [Bacteroidaceae bacterium]|nr:DUF3467 domain-containing protein [Bacteroidaceae bacterium]
MENQEKKTVPGAPSVDADPKVLEGIYANLAIIVHSSSEFVVDFLGLMPGMSRVPVKERLVLTPPAVKTLLMELRENLAQYEKLFGEIKIADSVPSIPNMPTGFKA